MRWSRCEVGGGGGRVFSFKTPWFTPAAGHTKRARCRGGQAGPHLNLHSQSGSGAAVAEVCPQKPNHG